MFWKQFILSHAMSKLDHLSDRDPQRPKYQAIVNHEYTPVWRLEDAFLKEWKLAPNFPPHETKELARLLCQLLGYAPPKHIKHQSSHRARGDYSILTDTISLSTRELSVLIHELAHHNCLRQLRGKLALQYWLKEELYLGTSHGPLFLQQMKSMLDLLLMLQKEALEQLPKYHPLMSSQHTALTLLQGESQKRGITEAWKKTKKEIGI